MPHRDTIICRCEDVTVGDIEEAVEAGARTLRAVQLCTRLGLCQGRSCGQLAAEVLARKLGRPSGDFRSRRPRPPAQELAAAGIAVELLSAAEARRLAPALTETMAGASFCPLEAAAGLRASRAAGRGATSHAHACQRYPLPPR